MEASTIHSQVGMVAHATGWHPRLRALESVTQVRIETDRIIVLVMRVKVRETTSRYVVTHQGREMISWHLERTGTYDDDGYEITTWVRDEDLGIQWSPVEEVVAKFDVPTPQEVAARAAWERDCYRPGTARFPMDRDQI